jgi:drug/metabolite transporter (DMT)-like permease
MSVPVLNFILGTALFKEKLTEYGIAGSVIVVASCTVVILADRKKTAIETTDERGHVSS